MMEVCHTQIYNATKDTKTNSKEQQKEREGEQIYFPICLSIKSSNKQNFKTKKSITK